ncbi:MAG: hypothetical protein GX892_11385 [Thermoanaerobacteraceae bacterium]|nr:hypothetical protein [Thermoanaerobacteraceae bacterium]
MQYFKLANMESIMKFIDKCVRIRIRNDNLEKVEES